MTEDRSHDINCELVFEDTCKCDFRTQEREAYRYAKEDAQDSLEWLLRSARMQPQPHGGARLHSAERNLRYAINGYPAPGEDNRVAASAVEPNTEEVTRLAQVLLAAWTEAEPSHVVTLFPASYVSTFVDMARAVVKAQRG